VGWVGFSSGLKRKDMDKAVPDVQRSEGRGGKTACQIRQRSVSFLKRGHGKGGGLVVVNYEN